MKTHLVCFQVDQYIFVFDIAMQDSDGETVLDSVIDLSNEFRSVDFGEASDFLSCLKQIHHHWLMLHNKDVRVITYG